MQMRLYLLFGFTMVMYLSGANMPYLKGALNAPKEAQMTKCKGLAFGRRCKQKKAEGREELSGYLLNSVRWRRT